MQTAEAARTFEQIDSILSAALGIDHSVDVDSLTLKYVPPPFDRIDLISPIAPPKIEHPPAEPVYRSPPEPTGMKKVFGKKDHARAVEAARAEWSVLHAQWADYVNRVLPQKNAALEAQHAAAERARQEALTAEKEYYERLCAAEKEHVAHSNALLDQFREALEAGDRDAVDDYIGLILNRSVYPEAFDVDHDYSFEPGHGELTIDIAVPAPDAVPTIKSYEYIEASEEIRGIPATQEEQRERYNRAVASVAVRTFYEVFQADRSEYVKTISLSVKTTAVNPATGIPEDCVFIEATADRSEFKRLNLARVDPAGVLTDIRSSVSKNAFGFESMNAG
ncbi:hypothetical protein GR927_15010 [Mycolicibacterium sp. 3033]|nr:hypothetical protein [Mycolicibacterium aurantiacum]